MDILEIAIATVVGVGIGVLSGLLGIGGGTVMVPIFKLGFGMTAIGATATSLFAIIPTSVSGAVMHLRQKTCIPKLGILAGIAGACMSPIGVQLASMSPGWAIMLAAAIVIANGTKPAPEPMPDIDLGRKVYLGLPIGAVAGLVAGYVGVGGGFLMVPMFLSLLGLDMKRASGSSLVAIGILCVPGAILQILYGNVAIITAIAVVVGSIPGAVLGAKATKYIPERGLRFAFAGVLFVAAVLLVAQEMGLF